MGSRVDIVVLDVPSTTHTHPLSCIHTHPLGGCVSTWDPHPISHACPSNKLDVHVCDMRMFEPLLGYDQSVLWTLNPYPIVSPHPMQAWVCVSTCPPIHSTPIPYMPMRYAHPHASMCLSISHGHIWDVHYR